MKLSSVGFLFVLSQFLAYSAQSQDFAAKTECLPNDPACSVCVRGVLEQTRRPGLDLTTAFKHYGMRTGRSRSGGVFTRHIQGVARLSDVDRDGVRIGRFILTDNIDNPLSGGNFQTGLSYGEIRTGGELDSIFSHNELRRVATPSINAAYAHPGGAQAHGSTVAIAMEQGPSHSPAAVFFMVSDPNGTPEIVNVLELDGSNGEGHLAHTHALAAGFTTLSTGHYLAAVAGRAPSREFLGMWFYISNSPVLSSSTTWRYVGDWQPECLYSEDASRLDECLGGANNIALVNDCAGSMFLIALNGSAATPGGDEQWIQVYRLVINAGRVSLAFEQSQFDRLSNIPVTNPSYRWSGSVSVLDNGGLAVFNTERRTNERNNRFVDGNIYLSERAALATCEQFPVLYEHNSFRGERYAVTRTEDNLHRFDWGRKISSACVPANWAVTLYWDRNRQGEPLYLEGPTVIRNMNSDRPGGRDWDNETSSVELNRSPGVPIRCRVPTLYRHNNFNGRTAPVTTSIEDLHEAPHRLGDSSSVCVPSGWSITLFEHKRSGGRSLQIDGPKEYYDLNRERPNNGNWDNKASSVEIDRP